ncbi:hypothetical protein CfE428DRAFT_3175 [Chthoniobacter flavus Ellin428]|uniref:Uncharacterized protein n=1 Tax=Chthoniobacter flavus Ellin428 TaxID=497964 RepID=B4D2Q0_9BACT|nr:hypothetical protein CfE428DRAFT_3175 [Chthoniobacter flavus Ellin428]
MHRPGPGDVIEQMRAQEMADALRMRGAQANVFIHVENGHLIPRHGLPHQRGEKFILRKRAGKNDPCLPA